jgi:GNAT superfamily N-acetyltransferase
MQIQYQRLTAAELPQFIALRIAQLRSESESAANSPVDLTPALRDYYTRHTADGTFFGWLAKYDGRIVGTGGMSVVEKPPYFGCPSGRIGLLSSMYTDPRFRRQGIATEILSRVIADAESAGCGTVQITASDMGVKLYTAFGFVRNGNFMQYRIGREEG